MTKYFLSILILIGLLVGGYYLVTRDSTDAVSDESIMTAQYANEEFGYSVSYPDTLTVREYAGGNAAFGTEDGDMFTGAAEVRFITISATPGDTLQEAAARELANLCAADSTTESFSCTGLDRILPFSTNSGLSGYELYLTGELRNLASGAKTPYRKGPYYVFPLSVSATAGSAIVVHAPLNQTAEEADAATIREIAKSLTVTTPVNASEAIEAYVAENISSLSTAPEVLGGTFYVTAIEAHDGAGTVSYEDGHNAYTADFTYSFDDAGSISIDSFVVRAQ